MDVIVIFKFDGIDDPDSEAATKAIESLTIDPTNAGIDCDSWHIEEALSE